MNGESFRDSIIPPTGYVGSPEASVPVEPGVDQQEYIQFLEDARSHARQKTEDLGSSPIAFKQLGEDLNAYPNDHQGDLSGQLK